MTVLREVESFAITLFSIFSVTKMAFTFWVSAYFKELIISISFHEQTRPGSLQLDEVRLIKILLKLCFAANNMPYTYMLCCCSFLFFEAIYRVDKGISNLLTIK